jgi:hypothetical protein
MTLMPEPTDPWYTKYTTVPWFLTALYVYPATLVATAVGAPPLSTVHIACMMLYTGSISYLVYRLTGMKSSAESQFRWRFSLRTLLIAITVIALGMGMIAYALR